MRNLICGTLIILVTAFSASAAVTLDILSPKKGKFLVTYDVTVAKGEHATFFTFPSNGLLSRDQIPEILSVTGKNTAQHFDYEVLPLTNSAGATVEGRYVVEVALPEPVSNGEKYDLEYKIILYNQADCLVDKNGCWTMTYETAHDVTFVIPKGQSAVLSSDPVSIEQENGRLVLRQKASAENKKQQIIRTLTFKTDGHKWWHLLILKF